MSHAADAIEKFESKPDISGHQRPASRNDSFRPGFGVGGSWMSGHGSTPMPGTFSPWSEERVAYLQARLQKQLGPEYVTQRAGHAGGGKLSYIEGWKVLNLTNEVFGFNGWSTSIVRLDTNWIDLSPNGQYNISVTAIVRITLADGCFHEDVGNGSGDMKQKTACLEKAQKEAVTDATKRALRAFGNLLGNCLYDKEYAKEVAKINVPRAKFNVNNLERRPEFTEKGAPGPSGPSAVPAHMTNKPKPPAPPPVHRSETAPPIIRPDTPLRSIDDIAMEDSFAGLDELGMDPEFMDGFDESMQMESLQATTPVRTQVGSSKTETPIYQHRSRPDQPVMPPPARSAPPQQIHQRTDHGSSKQPITDHSMASGPQQGKARSSSSGGSSSTMPDDNRPAPPRVGSFASNANQQQGNSNQAAAAARRAAMIAGAGPAIRPESPKIPSGGIDDVASRARAGYKTAAAKLEVDENADVMLNGASGGIMQNGFTSARGMKRTISEENHPTSPVKQSSSGEQTNRSAPRKVLGEIREDPAGGEMDYAKRQRAV